MLLTNFFRLVRIIAARQFHHIRHALDKERSRPATEITDKIAFLDIKKPIHKRGYMIGCEYLSGFRFRFVSVELVEEYAHHIFTAPFVRIDTIIYFANTVNKTIYRFLIFLYIHLYFRIDIKKNAYLGILFLVFLKGF